MALKQTETYNRLRSISYTDLSARINRLLTCDCSRLTHDQIESRVRRIADGYATKTAIVGSNGVFRARVNEGRDLFSSASELWYPPAAVVREGRFNRALSPRFYASNIPHAAVLETRPEVGDFVTVLYAATHCDTIWHLPKRPKRAVGVGVPDATPTGVVPQPCPSLSRFGFLHKI